mgnify:CR=1 FL=1
MATGNSILVLTLDEGWYEQLARRLRGSGIHSIFARGAKAAHEALRSPETAISMVLLRGESDWLFATRALRQFSREAIQVPCLVVDSSRSEAVRLRFMELGAQGCVGANEVISRVSAHLLSPQSAANERREPASSTESVPAREMGESTTADAPAPPSAPATEPQQADPAPSPAASTQSTPESLMYMKLGVGEISDALQFLTMSPRTGELEVHVDSGEQIGHVFLKKGEVVHIEFGDFRGSEAFAHLLAAGTGEAWFHEDREAVERTVRGSASQLLLEAAVLSDEIAAARETD